MADQDDAARATDANAGTGEPGDTGPEGGRMRRGPELSDSLKYSQEVTDPQDEPERPGRSLVTTSHEVIRAWAEARDAVPATVTGTEHGDLLGVLRLEFDASGDGGDDGHGDRHLRRVGWDEWLDLRRAGPELHLPGGALGRPAEHVLPAREPPAGGRLRPGAGSRGAGSART